MLIIIISILIAITIVIKIKKNCIDDDFTGVMCGITISIILILFFHMITYPIKLEKSNITTTQKIIATKYDSRVEGEISGGVFFRRCRIDEVDYYFYLTETAGIYKQEKILADNTVIKETHGQPRVVKKKQYIQNGIPNWIRIKFYQQKKVSESDTLFVPEGTISYCTKFEIF